MPIGAVLGGASIIGGVLGANSNRRAANRAAEASERGTEQSIALQRDVYNQNRQALSPFMQRGNTAGDAINALLGLGVAQPAPNNALATMGGPTPAGGVGAPYGLGEVFRGFGGLNIPINGNTMAPATLPATVPPTGTTLPATPALTPQQQQNQAFENFRNSTGYQFRINEGQNALNSGFAGSGLLQSGAALRALDDYRQNAAAAEFGNYVGLLGQQQAVGAGSASSLAGVGQNFASNAGNLIMNNASNQANAAIARGQNNPLVAGLGAGLGGFLGFGGFGG